MHPLEIAGLAVAALLFAVSAAISARRVGEIGAWALAWAVLIAAGLLLEIGADWTPARATGGFLAVLFPGLQLAGAFEYVDRPVPRWLIPGFAAIALLRLGTAAAGFEAQSHMAVVAFELAALLAAATVVYRSRAGGLRPPMEGLLIVGLLVIGIAEAVDAVLDMTGPLPGVPWTVWLGIGIPVGGSQIVVTFDRMQRHLEDSLHERERALGALEESNERFRAIAEHAHDLILEADAVHGIRYVNPRFCEMLGYEPAEVLGRHITDFAWARDEFPSRSDLAGRREVVFPPLMVRHRDGSPRWIESSARVYLREDAQRIVVIARDVTERRRTDDQLRKAQKLESLGLLAGGIAHDFNNLLTGILGNADLALSELSAEHPARELVEQAVDSSQHAAQLTRQLQAYSGGSPFEVRPVDLTEEIRSRAELLRTSVGERVQLELKLESGLPAVEADPTQLAQVLLNLVINAREACGDEPGTVRIATGLVRIEEPVPVAATGSLETGPYVFVDVEDTGHGIDASIRERLFDPFFTTKTTGRGLGLSVVHGVVKMLGAAITVDSTAQGGALFRLLLPASTGEIVMEAPRASGPLTGSEEILVIDDDAGVLDVVCRVLEAHGYRVSMALETRRAETILKDQDRDIALVLLDAVMPGDSSELFLDRLRSLNEDLPVLLISGYAETEAMQRFASERRVVGFLQKPFRSEVLAGHVRQVLDSQPPA